MKGRVFLCAVALTVIGSVAGLSQAASGQSRDGGASDVASFQWSLVNGSASWGGRAGLQAVELRNRLYVLGGRTPNQPPSPPAQAIPGDSTIWDDVWTSSDLGATWERTVEHAGWGARAYFQAVTKGGEMFVLGGQDYRVVPNPCPPFVPGCPPFVSTSTFFSDVWSSKNGADWTKLTSNAWPGRAGLSAVVKGGEIYVMGGSFNDDSAVIGGPPTRVYFNDVWKSKNGKTWTKVLDHAPWAPRAGAILVEKGGWIYLLGGEAGFVGPYFNDVWRSRNGADWEQVTPAAGAGWSPRPGHQCVVLRNEIVCFGGFGFPNPLDVWTSRDGAAWTKVSDSAWNAQSPAQGKYDFDALAVTGRGQKQSIMTFGGDRETFDFGDPDNWTRVDDEVWRFGPG